MTSQLLKWIECCHFFLFFTVQSHLLCVGKVRSPYYFSDLQSFELAMQDSHPSLYFTKPVIICTSQIHSGSLQKMLTALFNIVWDIQKGKWTTFFECQGKMFLSIEKVLEKISEDES